VTGVGMVTPLGSSPRAVLDQIAAAATAARAPTRFDARPFACPVCAEIDGFDPTAYVGASKALRLMSREAQLAVSAARLAMEDAGVRIGEHYAPDEVGLFGATGLAGLPLDEVEPLLRHSARADGGFDPCRFGADALRRVRPVLSFKILSNMPVCFVSMLENVQGVNAAYNPWEGQGAQAIAAGILAIERGEARCALVGGCDVKTHELAFIALEQQGVFRPWAECGAGPVPGEGAAFLVLEDEARARSRGACILGRVACFAFRTVGASGADEAACAALLSASLVAPPTAVVSGSWGGGAVSRGERRALEGLGCQPERMVAPKAHLGDLFAAAAAVQVGLAAVLAATGRVVASCFGYGREQAVFVLEGA